jgi:acyl carrier protein
MTDNEILDLIKDALANVAPKRKEDFASVSLDQTVESLQLDSIATMEMVGYLEDKVDLTFPDEELAKVRKLNDLAVLAKGERVSA